MNYRQPLINGEIYHVYNRGIDRRPTFTTQRELKRALQTTEYYRFADRHTRLSHFLSKDAIAQQQVRQLQHDSGEIVSVLAFCFMPNHFHFLLQQKSEGGVSEFVSQFQNSYTRFFNTAFNRKGTLFEGPFRHVRVESQHQLIHVARYIHLNPHTANIVRQINDLPAYRWSSLPEYLGSPTLPFVSTEILDQSFAREEHWRFIVDRADYQRSLAKIKHLMMDEDHTNERQLLLQPS